MVKMATWGWSLSKTQYSLGSSHSTIGPVEFLIKMGMVFTFKAWHGILMNWSSCLSRWRYWWFSPWPSSWTTFPHRHLSRSPPWRSGQRGWCCRCSTWERSSPIKNTFFKRLCLCVSKDNLGNGVLYVHCHHHRCLHHQYMCLPQWESWSRGHAEEEA